MSQFLIELGLFEVYMFKIGDEVIVDSENFPHQNELRGTVISLTKVNGYEYTVRMSNMSGDWLYNTEDLRKITKLDKALK